MPWAGNHVALLTRSDLDLDPTLVTRLLAALDAAWDY
jgi:hypothetical protein